MSTNYRVTTPKEFFAVKQPSPNYNSIFNNLSNTLKKSLHAVWNIVKNIDIKTSLLQTSSFAEQNILVPSILSQHKKTESNQPSSSPKSDKQDRSKGQETERDILSKKQKLKQKKQRKRISFEQFEQEHERRLNQSFIRKNIETRKALNKSIQSQLQNSLILPLENKPQQNTIQNQHPNQQTNQQNDSIILNISDIDSECNFNILNNQQLNEQSSKQQELNQITDNQQYVMYGINQGEAEVNVPRLELKEYPFLVPGKKIHYRVKNYKVDPTWKLNSSSNKEKPTKHSNLDILYIDVDDDSNNNQKQINNIIDLDGDDKKQKKRHLSSSANQNSSSIRKKLKPTIQMDEQGSINSQKNIQKQDNFDKLVANRYDKMIEEAMQPAGKGEISTRTDFSLKQQYEKFLESNFNTMRALKQQANQKVSGLKLNQHNQLSQKKLKFSQYLKPIDLSPIIERKKLYKFTRECESKISIKDELKKSVCEDKQRQLIEQMKRIQEEELRKKREEQEKKQREQDQRRRKEAEQRLKRQRQEALRVAEEMKRQQESQSLTFRQPQQREKEQTKGPEQNAEEKKQQTAKEILPQLDQTQLAVPKAQKEPAKQFGLFGVAQGSLFSPNSPKTQPEQNKKQDQKVTSEVKQPQFLTKKSSLFDKKSEEKETVKQSEKPVQPTTKPVQVSPLEQKKPQAKENPFLAASKPSAQAALLQQIINSKKDDNSLFKSTIAVTPLTINSPQRQPPVTNPNILASPLHNTSHYSNLDSSMCQQSQSNVTPGNSQVLGNIGTGPQNLNGSFLNNSISSHTHTNSLYPANSGSMFNNPGSSSLFKNAGSLGGSQTGMFAQQSQAPSGGLFSNLGGQQAQQNAKYEAINKVPSFIQNQSSIMPSISTQNAVSLFSQRSPSKNQQQSLFGPSPSISQKKQPVSRRDKKKQDRIK